ncbi:GTP cyclohydrolase IA [Geosmithia morbida]|uniref:GTP cyclohydrolase 1 n=1 Tax=Geosmithia morbida TaxID=1094350 RepID=A0A9P4YTH3_9HYPO|nr:GTP cyclohydrolase IA [Geosmithia morbida]KAF4120719.1 GTP cyclohydrolase IA [Geosmithia morbida]
MPRSDSSDSVSHQRHQQSKRRVVDDVSATTSSDDESTRSRKRSRRNGKSKPSSKTATVVDDGGSVAHPATFATRRSSLSKAARDPLDEPHGSSSSSAVNGEKKNGKGKGKGGSGGVVVKTTAAAAPSSSFTSSVPVIDFDGLSRPGRGTRQRRQETEEQAKERLEKMSGAVRTLLECAGEDADREGLLATPERYAKALLFFTKGYQDNIEDIVNGALFHEGHNEMVIVKDIEVNSLCEHHLVPFAGKVQERLTKEVAHAIMEILKPQGVAVVMEAKHLCMAMRGVEKTTASTITSCVLGCFERKSKTRNEFLSLVGVNR